MPIRIDTAADGPANDFSANCESDISGTDVVFTPRTFFFLFND
jgi:hypothetical protein